jgi:beta-lactamase class A
MRTTSKITVSSYYRSYSPAYTPNSARSNPRKFTSLTTLSRISKIRTFRLALVLLLMLGLVHFGWSKHVAAQNAAYLARQQQILLLAQQKSDLFLAQFNSLRSKHAGINLSVAIVSPQLGALQFGSPVSFKAASTAKLLTATAFLHEVELSKHQLQENIGSNKAQSLLEALIVRSDDTAWRSLNTELGHKKLLAYARSIGITDYDPSSNTLSAGSIALLLEKLNKGELLGQTHQRLLLSYMQRANFRDFIIPGVNTGNQVYHKVGVNEDYVHDAAIIQHDNKKLILVIFTNGNGKYNWRERASIMQQITKDAQAAFL